MLDYIEIIDNRLNSISYDVDSPDGSEANVMRYALQEIFRDMRDEGITLLVVKIHRKGGKRNEF